ncbi:MAG: DUF4010 domain-containing protein [Beijerinckiaceae bacterium]|nr:DUF4010 domain-containing protein [Beijerinckiaceae bacterium]MCI0736426.1 DUF4010 domain-containing protein [Beijerinckiaceae bacterium]
MPEIDPLILSFAIALGIGLLIGTERERRKRDGAKHSPAGIRTFALASLAGAVSLVDGGVPLLAITAGGTFGLAGLAYWRGPDSDPGLTTEIALVFTVLLGGLSIGRPAFAAGLAVVAAILLNARSPLHRFARSVLSEDEIKDALIFVAATLIVLPLLPNEQMGPYGAINPRSVWIIVILVMSIGALGHIAVRLAGAHYGLPVTGFASGFVSGTAAIAAMGARVAHAPELLWPASAGAVLSFAGTIVQLAVVLAATNLEVLAALSIPLALGGAAAVIYGTAFSLVSLRQNPEAADESGRAFNVWAAILFAAMLSAILLASRVMNAWFGEAGITATAAVGGLASTDPIAISIATLVSEGAILAGDASFPILIGLSANTLVKAALAMASRSGGFALRVIPGLAFVLLAAWIGWWWQY